MSRTSREILKKIHRLHQKRKEIVSALLSTDELAIGSVSRVKRRCGNRYCHCLKKPTHEQTIFVFTDEKGKRRCQHVRRRDEARLQKAAREYHEFQDCLRDLKHLNSEELALLRAYGTSRALTYEKPNF